MKKKKKYQASRKPKRTPQPKAVPYESGYLRSLGLVKVVNLK